MKKRLTILTIMGLSAGLILFTSCEKEYYVPFPIPDVITYSGNIQPYFDSKCANCHKGGSVPLDLRADVSHGNLINGGYVDTDNPTNSLLYTKINTGGSMEQYSTPEETEMVLKWITEGAKNN